MSAVRPDDWGDASSEGGRLQQELAGGRRAQQARRGRVCKARRAGGAAAQPAPTRELAGLWAKQQRRNDAGAHARRMRRRTSGLCQLTFHPRPISRLSSGLLLLLAACHTALPSGLELAQPMRWRRERTAARESRPTSSLTRNRRRKKSGSRCPKGAMHAMLGEGASRQTAGLPSWPQGPSPCSARALRRAPAGLQAWLQGPARTPDDGHR